MLHYSGPTAEQIYQENYVSALARAQRITGDFQDAQDAVQEAGIALMKMEGGEEVSTPIFFRIVRNKAVDAVRSRIRRKKIGEPASNFDPPADDHGKVVPLFEKVPDEVTPQPDSADQRAELEKLEKLLQTMLTWLQAVNPNGAAVVRLTLIEGRSQAEAAGILGVTENAVKCASRRARTLLRTRFRAAFDELSN